MLPSNPEDPRVPQPERSKKFQAGIRGLPEQIARQVTKMAIHIPFGHRRVEAQIEEAVRRETPEPTAEEGSQPPTPQDSEKIPARDTTPESIQDIRNRTREQIEDLVTDKYLRAAAEAEIVSAQTEEDLKKIFERYRGYGKKAEQRTDGAAGGDTGPIAEEGTTPESQPETPEQTAADQEMVELSHKLFGRPQQTTGREGEAEPAQTERQQQAAEIAANQELEHIQRILQGNDKIKTEHKAERIIRSMGTLENTQNIGECALAIFEQRLKESEILQDQGLRAELLNQLRRKYDNRREPITNAYYAILLSEEPQQVIEIIESTLNPEQKSALLNIFKRKIDLGADLEQEHTLLQDTLSTLQQPTEEGAPDREIARRAIQERQNIPGTQSHLVLDKEITTDAEYSTALRQLRSTKSSSRTEGENYLRYFVGPTEFRRQTQKTARERAQVLIREITKKDNIQDLTTPELAQVRSKLILELRQGIDPTDEQKGQKLQLIIQGIDNALAQPQGQEMDKAREAALQALQKAEGLRLDPTAKQEAINAALIENGFDDLVQNRELSLRELTNYLETRRSRQFTKTINDAIAAANEAHQKPGFTGDEIETARQEAIKKLRELGYNMDDRALIKQFSTTFTDLTQPEEKRTGVMRDAVGDIEGSGAQKVGAIRERLTKELGFQETEVEEFLMAEYSTEFAEATKRRDAFGDLAVESIREDRARQEKVKQMKKQLGREYTRFDLWSRQFDNMKRRFERWGLKLKNGLKWGLLFGGIGFIGPTAALTSVGVLGLTGAGILGIPSLYLALKYNSERMRQLQDQIDANSEENKHYIGFLKNKNNLVNFFEGIRTYQDTGDISKTGMGDIVFARALGINLDRKLEANDLLRQVREHVTYLQDIQGKVRDYLTTRRMSQPGNLGPQVNFKNA